MSQQEKDESWIFKTWVVIIGGAILGVLIPPLWAAVPLGFAYLVLRAIYEAATAPPGPPGSGRKNGRPAFDSNSNGTSRAWSDDWKLTWNAKCESPAEAAFLDAAIAHYELKPIGSCLGGNGITLDLQRRLLNFRVDFLVNDKLVVEVDGAAYHSSPRALKSDAARDALLREAGYIVQRITAREVFSSPDSAMAGVDAGIVGLDLVR